MIEIKAFDKVKLKALIDSPEFLRFPFLPISPHRAISHIHNPRAGERDVLLLIAFDDGNIAGYLGVLPDWIFDRKGNKHTCGWLSCMWVDEKYRGQGISKKLVSEALKAWDQKILVTEFTYAAKRLYDKTGAFKDLQIIDGIRLYIRSDLSRLLPPRGRFYQNLQPLWRVTDTVVNLLLDRRFLFFSKKHLFHQECIDRIDDEASVFIKDRQENQLFRRTKSELEWILNYPWVISAQADEISKKYHFSSVADLFEFKPLKLRDKKGKLIALILFARRDAALKIPYCYFDPPDIDIVMDCIRWYLIHWRIKTATLFHPLLVQAFRDQKSPAIFKKTVKRHYIISKVFDQFPSSEKSVIQDGDADCAFT